MTQRVMTRLALAAMTLGAVVAGCSGGEDPGRDVVDAVAPAEDTAIPERDSAMPAEDGATRDTGASDTGARDTGVAPEDTAAPLPGFSLACDVDGDCGAPCGDGRCVAGRCRFSAPTAGCVVPLDPASAPDRAECVAAGAASPALACLRCAPQIAAEGYTGLLAARDFDDGQLGLTVEKLADTPATWAVSARRAASGGLSLHFGQPGQGSYGVGARAAARATTPPIAVPEGARPTLAFEVWLDTEETPGFDLLTVLAVGPDADVEPAVLWTSDELAGSTHGEFLPVTLELGEAAADGMRIRFEFDTFDAIINDFEGAYVDTLRVTSGCCGDAGDCFDANPCTLDVCDGGACRHEDVAGCCLVAPDCDDGDPCTKDACSAVGGQCSATPVAGCCREAQDCDDGDPCTEDACPGDGGTCRHQPLCCERDADCVPGVACQAGACVGGQCAYTRACCEADGECDDGDPCTVDRCAGSVCAHAFSAGPGCCRPDVLTERFDGGAPAGWTFDPAVANIGWRVQASGEARSGTSTLYYGHPALFYYDTGGRNQGAATSASVRLPSGVEVFLTLAALLDVEAALDKDLVRVDALVGDTAVPLLTKAELAVGAWQTVTKDVSWLAGQVVRFRVAFDSVDALRNSTRGVFIDDLRVWSSCRPRPCETSPACTSPAPCITGQCVLGGCAYAGRCR